KEPSRTAAFLEMDARNGRITFLELNDKSFHDGALSQEISNRVYTALPARPSRWAMRNSAPLKRVLPYPTTNQVVEGITAWLKLCRSLAVDPGPETNLASVFWPQTFTYTNGEISLTSAACQIHFNNGTAFECINGVAFSHFASDACFTGSWQSMTREERER